MKLKELLKVIPDTYILGLTNADEEIKKKRGIKK
jgi:hypothetical protein